MSRIKTLAVSAAALATLLSAGAYASSHREAPFVAAHPTVDGTDFYMFRSYGTDASTDSVTMIANYDPLQAPGGGPNYFALNPNAVYDINVDNTGAATPNIKFRFQFTNNFKGAAVPSGGSASKSTPIPLIIAGSVGTSGDNKADAVVNRYETYTVTMYVNGTATQLKNPNDGTTVFQKPLDNIGNKSIADYATYVQPFMYTGVNFGSCGTGKVFAGQRREGFVVNLGEVFDLINTNPLGARNATQNTIGNKNITSLAVQVPTACLTADSKPSTTTTDPVIGGWTTSSLRQARILNPAPRSTNDAQVAGGPYSQVSRLGNPLVNELVIGLPDKDRFNASQPINDAQFAQYVTDPTLPTLISVLFPFATSGVSEPVPPRSDLVAAFLTGLTITSTDGNNTVLFSNAFSQNANKAATIVPAEMEHLNVSYPPIDASVQDNLGLLACQATGFPNGRRPADDVVDIELNAAEGALYGGSTNTPTTNGAVPASGQSNAANPNKLQTCGVNAAGTGLAVQNAGTVVTDGAELLPTDTSHYISTFPYLADPIPGSPNSARAAASTDSNVGGD